MTIDTKKTPTDNNPSNTDRNSSAADFFQGLFGSIYRTTKRLLVNFLPGVKNIYKRWRNERNRLPKRTSRNKAYLLLGYTTKEHINKRYRAMKIQNIIRVSLLISIILITFYILYTWLNPFGNTDEIKQIAGVDGIEDLTGEDPFGKYNESQSVWINDNSSNVIESSSVVSIPTSQESSST